MTHKTRQPQIFGRQPTGLIGEVGMVRLLKMLVFVLHYASFTTKWLLMWI